MKIAYATLPNADKLPLVAAAPIRLEMNAGDVEPTGFSYDALTQSTIGTASGSYCNIDESIGVPFNSSTDMKSDD
ncbi:hypothetical protein G6030_07625 [Dietzia sp. E1]|uniref:hypothetical protein n=1 Tax=Dietzia sp. E1 TaxID=328361 RepID=UPI0015F7BCEC|nr:hypothetical protein [Dietzia sp. E1]MBB1021150.1 hypothetical protein [Dietzia sp. E1]